MQAAAGDKRKVRAVRLALPRFDFPLEVKGATQGSWVPENRWPLPRFAFAHLALPVEDRDQGLVGRAAYHVGTSGEAFDDPPQILGRLLPRVLWGRWGPLTFPGCQKGRVASRRPLPPAKKGGGPCG